MVRRVVSRTRGCNTTYPNLSDQLGHILDIIPLFGNIAVDVVDGLILSWRHDLNLAKPCTKVELTRVLGKDVLEDGVDQFGHRSGEFVLRHRSIWPEREDGT